jgi:hypothetical protein
MVNCILSQLRQVLTHQGFTAGKEYHGHPELGKIIQKGFALNGSQLIFKSQVFGMSITVDALQVASAGDVPYHYRTLVLGELQKMGGEPP